MHSIGEPYDALLTGDSCVLFLIPMEEPRALSIGEYLNGTNCMLNNAPARYTTHLTSPDAGHVTRAGAGTPRLDFDELFAAVRRQTRVVGIAVGVTFGLGLVFLATAVPKYTATATLLIDSRRNQDQLSASIADLNFDTGAIDSQVEVLNSDNVALGVVKALGSRATPVS